MLGSHSTLGELAACFSREDIPRDLVKRDEIKLESPTFKVMAQQAANGLDLLVVILTSTRIRHVPSEKELAPEAQRTVSPVPTHKRVIGAVARTSPCRRYRRERMQLARAARITQIGCKLLSG